MMLLAPNYDRAYAAFVNEIFDLFTVHDQVFGDLERVLSRHRGPRRNVRGEAPLDQPLQEGSTIAQMSFADVVQTNLESHTYMMFQTVTAMLEHQHAAFFSGLAAISDKVGNTIQGDGTLRLKNLRDLIKKLDIAFNEDGTISRGLVVYGPSDKFDAFQELMAEADQDPEINAIVAAKYQEWKRKHAQRSHRALR